MATTFDTTPMSAPSTTADPATKLTFPRLVRSEWIKLWSLRSTPWTLGVSILATVGIAVLFAALTTSGSEDVTVGEGFDYSALVVSSVTLSQIGIAVLGVLAITGEYSTGMIRSTLTAAPSRLPVLGAKAIVLAAVAFVSGLLAAALTYFATLPILDGTGVEFDLSDPEIQRVLGGISLFFLGIALFSFAIGALVRHSAAAISIVLALFIIVESVWSALPAAFFYNTGPFLPGNAGAQLLLSREAIELFGEFSEGPVLGPWEGFGVLMAWVVVLLVIAAILLRRRDA